MMAHFCFLPIKLLLDVGYRQLPRAIISTLLLHSYGGQRSISYVYLVQYVKGGNVSEAVCLVLYFDPIALDR